MTWIKNLLTLFAPVKPEPLQRKRNSYPVNQRRIIKRRKP